VTAPLSASFARRGPVRDAPSFSQAEKALISAVDALHHRSAWSEAEFAAAQGTHYDEDKVLEVILLCGFYRTVSHLANGLALPLEENAARFPR
jgi:alkylhydroperoxidase family enzyme